MNAQSRSGMGAQKQRASTQNIAGLLLFCRSALLAVRPDARERYGGRVTLCWSSAAGWRGSRQQSRNSRRADAPTVFRSGSAAEAKQILLLHQLQKK